jgi:hypothetical protein
MVRTQIQLTSDQASRLKRLAAASGRSIADLVRDGVDRVLREQRGSSRAEQMQRAARVFGTFDSGSRDLSTRHDHHFAEAAAVRR